MLPVGGKLMSSISPGLNSEINEKLMAELKKRTYADLVNWKVNILTFVDACRSAEAVHQNLLFPLCLIGLCEPNDKIKNKAEAVMRRLDKLDYNNSELIGQLYQLFLGSSQTTPAPKKRTPASENLRLLILDHFLKSKTACNSFPLTLQLIYECLFGKHASGMYIYI